LEPNDRAFIVRDEIVACVAVKVCVVSVEIEVLRLIDRTVDCSEVFRKVVET
jgi:hypothetical protein